MALKKIAYVILLITLFVFASCQQEQPTIITCADDEILVEGVCEKIDVKTDFEKTFDAMEDLDNYTLIVTIQQFATVYEIEMKVDDDKSSFMMDDQTHFYQKNGTQVDHYFPVGEGYRKETVNQSSQGQSFHFFNDLEASWFQEVSGKYFLNADYNDDVALFFQSEFPGSTVSNLELLVGDTHFSQIIFNVTVGEVMYQFTMTITAIGQTDVALPTV